MVNWSDILNIKVLAKSSFAIVAVLAVIIVIGYFTLGIDTLIDIAWRLAVTVIIGGVAIAITKSYNMDDKYKLTGVLVCLVLILVLWKGML